MAGTRSGPLFSIISSLPVIRQQSLPRASKFWLNSAQHLRKVDQCVSCKLRRWVQAKHQRRRRAFWRAPLAYWRAAGLYAMQGGPYCAHGLNAVGGRLPESRMKENLTYGLPRGLQQSAAFLHFGSGGCAFVLYRTRGKK